MKEPNLTTLSGRFTTPSDLEYIRGVLAILVEQKTFSGSAGITSCSQFLRGALIKSGFSVDVIVSPGASPLLLASRKGKTPGHLFLYNHYDVDEPGGGWSRNPWRLEQDGERWYGCGVADNKAALATRLIFFSSFLDGPGITWLIQGEEESGSGAARSLLSQSPPRASFSLYLDENGYLSAENSQRLLACVEGHRPTETMPPDGALWGLLELLALDAKELGSGAVLEVRKLNKSLVPRGCPFQTTIPYHSRYLAIGVNDHLSKIHQPDESVPIRGIHLHYRQLMTIMRWATEAR